MGLGRGGGGMKEWGNGGWGEVEGWLVGVDKAKINNGNEQCEQLNLKMPKAIFKM